MDIQTAVSTGVLIFLFLFIFIYFYLFLVGFFFVVVVYSIPLTIIAFVLISKERQVDWFSVLIFFPALKNLQFVSLITNILGTQIQSKLCTKVPGALHNLWVIHISASHWHFLLMWSEIKYNGLLGHLSIVLTLSRKPYCQQKINDNSHWCILMTSDCHHNIYINIVTIDGHMIAELWIIMSSINQLINNTDFCSFHSKRSTNSRRCSAYMKHFLMNCDIFKTAYNPVLYIIRNYKDTNYSSLT